MAGKIKVDDLPEEVLEQLGLKPTDDHRVPKMVKSQIIAMGGVLQSLKGLTNRQALWVLRTSIILVRGYSQDKQRNPKTTLAERRRKIVDKRQQLTRC